MAGDRRMLLSGHNASLNKKIKKHAIKSTKAITANYATPETDIKARNQSIAAGKLHPPHWSKHV
jgi:hypothetical protein